MDIIAETKTIFNDICILYDLDIVRVVGIEDNNVDNDVYYICKTQYGSLVCYSCVGTAYSLREYLPKDKYERIENIFNLNGGTPELEFIYRKIEEPE